MDPTEPQLTGIEQDILTKVCTEQGVPADLIELLIAEEQLVYGMGRRHGLHERIDRLIREHAHRITSPAEVLPNDESETADGPQASQHFD